MVSFRSHLAARFAVTALLAANVVRAADTDAVLNGWFAAQNGVHSISADFTQTRTLKTLVQPLIAHGHLWFAPPDQFRWELGHPAQTIALRHGDDMYIVYPRLKRAEHYPLGSSAPREWRDAMALLDVGFPRTRQQFDAQFQVRSMTQTNGDWLLKLEPRQASARQFMPELGLFLAQGNYGLAGTELTFIDGSTMKNLFDHTMTNAPVDEKMFQWHPPAGYTVTEPFSK